MKTHRVKTDFGVEIDVIENPLLKLDLDYDPAPWVLVAVWRDGRILASEEIDEDTFCALEDFMSEVDELIRNPHSLCEP